MLSTRASDNPHYKREVQHGVQLCSQRSALALSLHHSVCPAFQLLP